MDAQFNDIYSRIQIELKAPKNQYNSFAKYKYRSCEDILEAIKPLLDKYHATVSLTDEVVLVGDRYYIKATATLRVGDQVSSAYGYAREPEQKKGLDESQITGMASSYARKYALNGLFCIDDTKDADTMDNSNEGHSETPAKRSEAPTKQEDDRPWMTEKQFNVILERIKSGDLQILDKAKASMKMKKEYKERLENALHEYKVNNNLV